MKKIIIILFIANLFAVDYESEIQPIFDDSCDGCHNGNHSSGLDLRVGFSYESLFENNSVVPGNHALSDLYERLILPEGDQFGDMPPSGSLSQEDINLIVQWIDEGALPEESVDIVGCTDPNAITCDDDIDPLYFPECDTCSDGVPCENYYNPDATVDNGLCMYNDVPLDNQFSIEETDTGFNLDWNTFQPPVDILGYVIQRCVDNDGDSDGDGVIEYDSCEMIIPPNSSFLDTNYFDEFILVDGGFMKYTFYVHYPNNNYWGSANTIFYFGEESCLIGDVSQDGIINVIDIVSLVNHILGTNILIGAGLCA